MATTKHIILKSDEDGKEIHILYTPGELITPVRNIDSNGDEEFGIAPTPMIERWLADHGMLEAIEAHECGPHCNGEEEHCISRAPDSPKLTLVPKHEDDLIN
jgi:hypothetical protein